jgi:hypothetical protein
MSAKTTKGDGSVRGTAVAVEGFSTTHLIFIKTCGTMKGIVPYDISI